MRDVSDANIQGTQASRERQSPVSAPNNNNAWNSHSLIPVLSNSLMAKIDKQIG